MKNVKKTILVNSVQLYKKLSIYGIDRYDTKRDILLLSIIDDILSNNCYFNFLDLKTLMCIEKILEKTLRKNPSLKNCRIDINDYKNLGGKQNITTYQIIKTKEDN